MGSYENFRSYYPCIEMIRDRIIGIPFGDHDCGFQIMLIEEGTIDPAFDETLLPDYRNRNGINTP